jgi:hypothetical protein
LIKVSDEVRETFFQPPILAQIFDLIEDPIFVFEDFALNGAEEERERRIKIERFHVFAIRKCLLEFLGFYFGASMPPIDYLRTFIERMELWFEVFVSVENKALILKVISTIVATNFEDDVLLTPTRSFFCSHLSEANSITEVTVSGITGIVLRNESATEFLMSFPIFKSIADVFLFVD